MNSGWNDRFVQAAKRKARFCFRDLPREQREELTNDVISSAWEVFNEAPDRTCPTSAARFAVLRVKARRHFDESHRSLTGPPRRGYYRPCRSDFKLSDFIRFGEDPALIAAFNELYAIWFSQLNERQRQ